MTSADSEGNVGDGGGMGEPVSPDPDDITQRIKDLFGNQNGTIDNPDALRGT